MRRQLRRLHVDTARRTICWRGLTLLLTTAGAWLAASPGWADRADGRLDGLIQAITGTDAIVRKLAYDELARYAAQAPWPIDPSLAEALSASIHLEIAPTTLAGQFAAASEVEAALRVYPWGGSWSEPDLRRITALAEGTINTVRDDAIRALAAKGARAVPWDGWPRALESTDHEVRKAAIHWLRKTAPVSDGDQDRRIVGLIDQLAQEPRRDVRRLIAAALRHQDRQTLEYVDRIEGLLSHPASRADLTDLVHGEALGLLFHLGRLQSLAAVTALNSRVDSLPNTAAFTDRAVLLGIIAGKPKLPSADLPTLLAYNVDPSLTIDAINAADLSRPCYTNDDCRERIRDHLLEPNSVAAVAPALETWRRGGRRSEGPSSEDPCLTKLIDQPNLQTDKVRQEVIAFFEQSDARQRMRCWPQLFERASPGTAGTANYPPPTIVTATAILARESPLASRTRGLLETRASETRDPALYEARAIAIRALVREGLVDRAWLHQRLREIQLDDTLSREALLEQISGATQGPFSGGDGEAEVWRRNLYRDLADTNPLVRQSAKTVIKASGARTPANLLWLFEAMHRLDEADEGREPLMLIAHIIGTGDATIPLLIDQLRPQDMTPRIDPAKLIKDPKVREAALLKVLRMIKALNRFEQGGGGDVDAQFVTRLGSAAIEIGFRIPWKPPDQVLRKSVLDDITRILEADDLRDYAELQALTALAEDLRQWPVLIRQVRAMMAQVPQVVWWTLAGTLLWLAAPLVYRFRWSIGLSKKILRDRWIPKGRRSRRGLFHQLGIARNRPSEGARRATPLFRHLPGHLGYRAPANDIITQLHWIQRPVRLLSKPGSGATSTLHLLRENRPPYQLAIYLDLAAIDDSSSIERCLVEDLEPIDGGVQDLHRLLGLGAVELYLDNYEAARRAHRIETRALIEQYQSTRIILSVQHAEKAESLRLGTAAAHLVALTGTTAADYMAFCRNRQGDEQPFRNLCRSFLENERLWSNQDALAPFGNAVDLRWAAHWIEANDRVPTSQDVRQAQVDHAFLCLGAQGGRHLFWAARQQEQAPDDHWPWTAGSDPRDVLVRTHLLEWIRDDEDTLRARFRDPAFVELIGASRPRRR